MPISPAGLSELSLTTPSEFEFIGGVAVLGILSIGAGFVTNKIPLIVLRALSGIGKLQIFSVLARKTVRLTHLLYAAASMTIPSALTLLVNVFTEPNEQARAIGVFGGCGAVGNGKCVCMLPGMLQRV